MRFVISAGHGLGSRKPGQIDPGAVSGTRKEYITAQAFANRITLDLAALGHYALFRDSGYYATADDDAASYKADCFIEYHLNAGVPSATGTESWVGLNATPREKKLASALCAATTNTTGIKNRGVKVSGDLAVLRQHGFDSVLCELYFVTNDKDATRFSGNIDSAELAHLNAILVTYGLKPVKSLPRKWSTVKARIAQFFRRK